MFISDQIGRRTKLLFCVGAVIAAVLAALSGPALAQKDLKPVDRVIAVVNDEVITLGELTARISEAEQRLRSRNVAVPANEILQRQVLESLILERAQTQYSKSIGLRISDQELQQALEGIAKENRLTLAELRDRLRRDNVPFESFRKTIRSQMIRARLRETEVQSKVTVSEADIDAFLVRKSGGTKAQQYRVEQILIKVSEQAQGSELSDKQARADELRSQLVAGGDFAQIAASGSDTPQDTSLGWRTLEQLPDLFAQAVRTLKPGEVSPVLRSPAGLHLLKLVASRGGDADSGAPVTQTRVRHILIRPNDDNPEAEILRRLAEIKDRVQAGNAEFGDMARQYSSDGSASRGGELGWVYPGDTVPEFERAMNELAADQISDPIRTSFGFHVIQVLERRESQASEERQRFAARQAVLQERTEQAFSEWLAELRDRTYVELRFE